MFFEAFAAVPVVTLERFVLVACDGTEPNQASSFLATIEVRENGDTYRVLTMNESIRQEAGNLLAPAQCQADEAALADAQLFAAGSAMYASAAGIAAALDTACADRYVVVLQRLFLGESDFGRDGWVDVQDWQQLLKHFGRSLSIGAI